jgi:hypothetical protein
VFGRELLKVVGKLPAKAQTQNSYPDARLLELLDGRRHGQPSWAAVVMSLEPDEQRPN